ncbi:MAG TPA: carboxypeptidase-like regulatory domain-containing protein, partial [Gemmatimonadaceae bacterium]|nr:carboxypeptidase-like regulatory domain-containing protein [Gemmatimonadaceae bacterium]
MIRLAHIGGIAVLCCIAPSAMPAQGVTSAGIRGEVRSEGQAGVDGARVRVTHIPSGYFVETNTRAGRFIVQGLEPGGPYAVSVRRIGAVEERREGIMLRLGEILDFEFLLRPPVATLETQQIRAAREEAHAHGGTATTIDQRMITSLPTLNRDFYDFVRLVPHVTTKVSLPNGGFSAGGVGFRFNNFLINGVSERSISGSVSSSFSGLRSMSLDAVKEYE